MIKLFVYKSSSGGGNEGELENALNEFLSRSDITVKSTLWLQSSGGTEAYISHMLTCIVTYEERK